MSEIKKTLRGIDCGSTVVGLEFDEGIVVAFIAPEGEHTDASDKKFLVIEENIICCCGGNESATDIVTQEAAELLMQLQPPLIYDAALLLSKEIRPHCETMPYKTFVCGWDEQEGGQVYRFATDGEVSRQVYYTSGPGSNYVHGNLLDQDWQDMTLERCLNLVKLPLLFRIAQNYPVEAEVRMCILTQDGIRYLSASLDKPELIQPVDEQAWFAELNWPIEPEL